MDEFTREEMEQLLGVFRDQTIQILEEMGQDLLALERGDSGDEVMLRLRRGAHTIKGDSACVGLEGITEIAHRVEDVFCSVASGERGIEKSIIDLMLEVLDSIRNAVCGEQVSDIEPTSALSLIKGLEAAGFNGDDSNLIERGDGLPGSVASVEGNISVERKGQTSTRRQQYVRVESAKIDALLNLAGEMVISRSMINLVGTELERALPKNDLVARYGAANLQIGKLIAELQKSVLKMRMVTIDQVFRRFARPMRELAHDSRKQIDLEMRGGDTELDRALVDLLYEPLLHLLRNAVDHGIETIEERIACGKPETGRIAIRAYHEGNQVVVEVSDDGRGIDPSRLKEKAVEAGAVAKVEADLMEDDEAFELIFVQGLSTAREVSKVSGRGIGASAARSAIEQLRGSVSVQSEAGIGTRFILRMPLTLAIIRALLFTSGGRLFALPLLSVSEIARAQPSDISCFDGFECYRLRDRFISLVRPGVVFGYERRSGIADLDSGARHLFIIVLAVEGKSYAVVADTLVGEQELVIKPLEGDWVQNDALAGASILGDGRVVLIMDADRVFRKAVRHERSRGNGNGVYAG